MHKPVMLEELITFLKPVKGGIYVDCTGGGGGHAEKVLGIIGKEGKLIILDRDMDACKRLKDKFPQENVFIFNRNFSQVDQLLESIGLEQVDGLYADFGTSLFQLSEGIRGFSFRNDGPLDMRMNQADELTADIVVNTFPEETLVNIFKKYGEEPFAKKIAYNIVGARAMKKIDSTKVLAQIVFDAIPKKFHKPGVHPATKVFQALRIFVNKELEEIESLLAKIEKIIKKGGRVVFISFHSLEDRLVKDMLQLYAKTCVCDPKNPVCTCKKVQSFKIVTKKPVTPSEREVKENNLSRSAKLRAAEKLV